MSGSADKAANYPAFNAEPTDAARSQDPVAAAARPALRPRSAAPGPSTTATSGIVRAIGRIVHFRLLFLIVMLGVPLLAFCILAGR